MNNSILRTASRKLTAGKSLIKTPAGLTNCTTRAVGSAGGAIILSYNNNINSMGLKEPQQYTSHRAFKTRSFEKPYELEQDANVEKPGSKAFAECETDAIQDLFFQFAQIAENGGVDEEGSYLSLKGVEELLKSIGENPSQRTLKRMFNEADLNHDGKLHLNVSYL